MDNPTDYNLPEKLRYIINGIYIYMYVYSVMG